MRLTAGAAGCFHRGMSAPRVRCLAALAAVVFCAPLVAPAACLNMPDAGETAGHGCCSGAGLTAGPPECCITSAPADEAPLSLARAPRPMATLEASTHRGAGTAPAPLGLPAARCSWAAHDPPPVAALRI
jgi:hypothetical protein